MSSKNISGIGYNIQEAADALAVNSLLSLENFKTLSDAG
jgi:hypothetical protein